MFRVFFYLFGGMIVALGMFSWIFQTQLLETKRTASFSLKREGISSFPTEKVALLDTASPTQRVIVTPTQSLKKRTYKIALFGDSMIDTMADVSSYLMSGLNKKYPGATFIVYNYGIGAQNISAGVARWESSFSNRGRVYSPISEVNADIIVVGSFAYNPFAPHDKTKHRENLLQLIAKAKQTKAKIYLLAEIAPLGEEFGKGIKGVNWPEEVAKQHARNIIEQIDNVFVIGREQSVPVIDVFNTSKGSKDEFGRKLYVNFDDGIHPSNVGHQLMADVISSTLQLE